MIAAGTQLGPYEIVCPLGAGGMGEVYRARDHRLGRDVALKVLPEAFAGSAERLARFEREARAVAALAHPNVLAIHDFGKERGTPYAVMELLEGETLRQRVARAALPWRKALAIAAAIAEGLAAAHAKGIVHRDLKPENVFLTTDGRVKILDFGLARTEPEPGPQAETGPYAPGLTETGAVMGTVGYLSPEQVRGEAVDARSDLFSLGCVLHELLTGRQPFQRRTRADSLAAALHEDPPELAAAAKGVPAGLERVARRCLEKNPEERFQSARDLAFDLQALVADPSARPAAAPRRLRLAFWCGAGAALLLVAGIAVRSLLSPAHPGPKRIAVLPVLNETGNKNNDSGPEITELLIGRLQVRGLVVRPFSAVAAYADGRPDLQEVGQKLRVDYLLVGRLGRGGKLSVELVDVTTEGRVWGDSYPFFGDDVYGGIAQKVLGALGVPLPAEEMQRLGRPLTESREALALYLKGQRELKGERRENVEKAIDYFLRAQEADPKFSLPYLGLADAYYWQSGMYAAPREVMPRARDAARQALELDDRLGEAHALLAFITAVFDWDWPAAEKGFRRALELTPGSKNVHVYFAMYLGMLGRVEESLAELKQIRDLDPLAAPIPGYALLPLYFARQHDEAIQGLRSALETDPKSVNLHAFLGLNLEQKGEASLPEAIEELERARALDGANDNPETYAQLGHAYARARKKEEALKQLERLKELRKTRYVSSYNFALIYAGLGQADDAFGALQDAAEEQTDWFACVKVDPRLDPLRDDPRFAALLRQAHLSP
jgi:tetratricopeptide (TPR) repeat protein/TolB-like protein